MRPLPYVRKLIEMPKRRADRLIRSSRLIAIRRDSMTENLAEQLALLPEYFRGHLALTLISLIIGIAISIRSGSGLHRRRG